MKKNKKTNDINKYALETMVLITNVVCSYYKLPNSIIESKSRKRNVIIAKQFIIYFSKKLIRHTTMKQIADFCKYKTHCNILYSIKTVENQIEVDSQFKHDFMEIDKLLKIHEASLHLGADIGNLCYYIDLNDIVSVKADGDKAIIFKNFKRSEINDALSLLTFLTGIQKPQKHLNTKLHILENKINEED